MQNTLLSCFNLSRVLGEKAVILKSSFLFEQSKSYKVYENDDLTALELTPYLRFNIVIVLKLHIYIRAMPSGSQWQEDHANKLYGQARAEHGTGDRGTAGLCAAGLHGAGD